MAEITTSYLDDQGQEQHIDTDALARGMAQSGYNVVGKDPDGQMVTIQDDKGQFKMHVHDVLHNLGYKVTGSIPKPDDTNYNGVNLSHRMAITELPDDDAKKAYIEAKTKREGIADPKVIGKGRDWFYYDPDAGKYVAVTHSPHWDPQALMGDLGEAIPMAAHTVGAVAGGAAAGLSAAPTVIGAIPAAMAGSAAGGMGTEAVMRGILAKEDPDYANALSTEEQLKEIGLSGLPDAVIPGAGGLLAKGAGRFLGPAAGKVAGMISKGPISSAVRGAGEGLAAVGDVAATAGRGVANSKFAQEGIAAMTPGLSQVQTAANLARVPEFLSTGVPRVAKMMGESPKVASYIGEENAGKLANWGKSALESVPQSEEARAVMAPDKITRLQQLISKGYQKAGLEAPTQETAEAQNVLAGLARRGAEETGLASPASAEAAGAQTGRLFQKLEQAGKTLDSAATGTVKAGAQGLRGVGNAAYYGGKGAATLGQIGQPLEALGAGQIAGHNELDPALRKDFSFFSEENAKRRAKEKRRDETFAYMPTDQ